MRAFIPSIQCCWTTRDSLDIPRGLNSASIDFIYLDPPFNSNRNYAAPVGHAMDCTALKNTWTLFDLDVAWMALITDVQLDIYKVLDTAGLSQGKPMQSYACKMAVRLLEMRRVVENIASIYLHCDPIQKPLALLERIIRSTSNEGDVVLDPFCGCATAYVAAEKLGWRWIIRHRHLAQARRVGQHGPAAVLGRPAPPSLVTVRTDIPVRKDIDTPMRHRESKPVLPVPIGFKK